MRRGRRVRVGASGGRTSSAAAALTPPVSLPTTQTDVPEQMSSRAAAIRWQPGVLLGVALGALRRWAARQDWTLWALLGITLLALLPRLYGINWDANNHLHPDEREIVFKSICLSFPGTPRAAGCDPAYTGPGWFFSPASPLNPHFFAYGTLPQYLLAAVAHGLAWLTHATGGHFAPSDGGTWDDFNHFTLVGRFLSALFDAGSVLLSGLIARRLAGRWAGLLAAAFVATTAFEVQVSHFYAVDTLLLFFVLLTLLGCVRLAQGPRPRHTTASEDGDENEQPRREIWQAWRAGLFIGVGAGLALAVKVSALPLLAPVLVALALRLRRRGFDEALLALLGIVSAAILAFLITSPYVLIDWQTFRAQVNEQTMLSRGQLDYPYVRQFTNETPFVYQIQQMLLYDMGLPLGLLGLAGFTWAASRLWRTLNNDWTIVVVWLVGYFAVIGSAYMKFTRYMLPVFAPLAICGAAALVAFAAWGTRRIRERTTADATDVPASRTAAVRAWLCDPFAIPLVARLSRQWGAGWWRTLSVALVALVLASSLVLTLALVNVYSAPNTRVQASEWIYDHIRPGATLTSEVWDDPLPIYVPPARTDKLGIGYTASGQMINPGEYGNIGLNLYDDDTPAKAQQLASQLASADVVIISSQRLLRSIPKLPDRYPMTTRYYQLLFAGKLGFTLAAQFQTSPHFLGFTLNDSGADESYSVYDHPPVWIFTKTGAGLSQEQLLTLLTSGLNLPPAYSRSGAEKSLLLSPQDIAADAQSQPLGVQFPANSIANQLPLIWWLLVVELLGLISFPFAYFVFPGLRDRGWGLAKLLGLLLLAWLVWLPSSLHILPFDRWAVIGVFALLAVAGGALSWWRREQIWAFVRERWRLLVICEGAFLVAFLFFAWIRALDPDLWHIWRGGEKPMELAYLNAILRSRYMPPLDPWFAGGYINYYYYGQYLIAVLIKLTGIVPTTAFNLAIPLLFAVTFTGAFSVVAGLTKRWWAGLAGGLGLMVVGNLDGLGQLIGQWRAVLAHFPAPPFDYWQSSRVIPFTINEFPYWSFLYADLHAHLIDLPIVVLLIACCASLVAGGSQSPRSRPSREGTQAVGAVDWRGITPTLAAVALALGAAWCTNTWDVPTYALLFAVALAIWLLPVGAKGTWRAIGARIFNWPTLRNYGMALGLTLAATYALYLPFHSNFQNFVSGTGPVTTPTAPILFFTVFGLWLFLIVSFFFLELRDRLGVSRDPNGEDGMEANVWDARSWTLLLIYGAVVFIAYLASVKALLLVLIALGLYLALNPRHAPARLFTYMLLLLGLGIAFGVEVIYVRDWLDNSDWERMNTVFKFYYQVWTLFALGGALAFAYIVRRLLAARAYMRATAHTSPDEAYVGWRPVGGAVRLARAAWLGALLLLIFGSSVFLVEGTQARLQDPLIWAEVQPPPGGLQPQGLSLDGMAYMRGWYPGDYAAITWMNDHIAGAPVIVEASSGVYNWQGRVSVYTGLPAVLSEGHELEQRYQNEVYVRQADVESFWSTPDPEAARSFLAQYGVKYVYLGDLERTCYVKEGDTCVPMSPDAIAKFQTLEQQGILRTVYNNQGVTIYEVTG